VAVLVPSAAPDGYRVSSLGAALRKIREARGLSMRAVAATVGFSTMYVSLLEAGERHGTAKLIDAYVDAFELGDTVRVVLERAWATDRRRRLELASACSAGCLHDGEMRPGGRPEQRHDECINYDRCLDAVVARYPKAREAHCAPRCSRHSEVPRHVTQAEHASGRRERG